MRVNLEFRRPDGSVITTPEPEPLRFRYDSGHGLWYDQHGNCPHHDLELVPARPEDANGPDEGATKPSNPKDIIGARKLDMGNVPDALVAGAAVALLEGALKYGRFNWRIAGVRASIYHAALRRHLAKWWNGQDCDAATRVHHLDNAAACIAILRDAEVYGKLTDDRPPSPKPDATAELIDGAEAAGKHLRELFKDADPYQYTIGDTPRGPK